MTESGHNMRNKCIWVGSETRNDGMTLLKKKKLYGQGQNDGTTVLNNKNYLGRAGLTTQPY